MIRFILVVAVHHLIAVGLVVGGVLSIIFQPWYVALILCTSVVRICTSRDVCVLTNLERDLRKELGLKPLKGGFIKHYYLK